MQQLPADTVRLLSSSQVITSVLNVVKELMENSLDAGGTCVDVTLENYGLDRVEVRDNGRGIQVQDTAVMAVRHYTSKICCHDDLECLDTYGFRGEALGSICAVAEVCVTTKTQDDDISTQYSLDLAGKVFSQKPSHLGQGTSVCVLKLFQKLPVRRQYYANAKKCREELKKVQDLLMAYGIMRPELRLTLTHNKVVAWQKARVPDHRSALLVTLGSSAVANLVPCHHQQLHPQISLEGFFPKPGADYISSSSTSPDRTFLFINTRPVHNKDIMKLVRQRYLAQYAKQGATSSSTGRYPAPLVLMVTVPPCSLDVNLTPDKTQVLLHNKEAVLTALEAMLVSLYGYRSAEAEPPDASSSTEHNRSPETETEAADASSADHSRRSSEDGEPSSHDDPHHLPLSTDNSVPRGGARSGQRDGVPRGEDSVPSPRSDSVRGESEGSLSGQRDSIPSAAPHNANSSSSSSVSEDWVINSFDASLLNPCSNDGADTAAANHPECSWSANRLADDDPDEWVQNHPGPEEAPGERQPSAESWSAGTALSDPVSGKPLQPVRVHRPVSASHCHDTTITTTELAASPEVGGQRLEDRKTPNMVTEKRGSLTAYHLISQRATRAALSPQGLFDREARASVLADAPSASPHEVGAEVSRRWESLSDAERHKYEEKAKQQQEQQRNKMLSPALTGGLGQADPRGQRRGVASQGAKRKAPSNHQQLLDELFNASSAPKKSRKPSDTADAAKPCQPLPFNMADLRLRHGRLWSSQSAEASPANPPPRGGGIRLVERLCAVSQSAWLLLRGGRSLALVNPCRVEEALLFRRLLEENVLPAVSLPHPVTLTDSVLGGAELWQALCTMQKSDRCDVDGRRSFCDPRLVANGFTVMECPADGHLEVTAMADCVPFVGLEDLREIVSVVQRSGSAAQGVLRDCRPLKVTNYLQGEAVRLARQLPARPCRDDVKAIVLRMERQLGVDDATTCIHGRPLLQPLCDVPEDESQALALLHHLRPLSL